MSQRTTPDNGQADTGTTRDDPAGNGRARIRDSARAGAGTGERTSPRWQGEISAISTAFIEHSSLLKRFLTRFFFQRQDIEDVVQEVYLRAYSAEQETVIDHPKAFLFRVARNVAVNELRRKARYIDSALESGDAPTPATATATLEDEIQARQYLGLYCEAIAHLPEQCRRVCLLRKVHGLKHREIAERMDLCLSSVEKHLRKGALACDDYIREREEGREPVSDNTTGAAATRQASATRPAGRPARACKELDQ